MRLEEVLDSRCVAISVPVSDRRDALRQISQLAARHPSMNGVEPAKIEKALADREKIGSTGVGHAVAIPHCRLEGVDGFAAGMLRSAEGIDLDSPDGEPVALFFFLVGPAEDTKHYLRLLSCIAQLLRREELRQALLKAGSPEEATSAILGQTRPEVAEEIAATTGMKLFHVFIQDESVFEEILQVFAATETFSTVVLDTHESTDYLTHSPLFAGFWDTELRTFSRLIMATVRPELANAVLRNIEYVCGDLSSREDVMVTISPLDRISGSLGG
jgi:PTS system nitrogen regulatory IIA component